jgi:hypothetical protein
VQDWSDADTIGDFWTALCVEFHKKFQVEDNDAMLVGGPVVDYGISIPRSDRLYRQDCEQKQIPYEVKAGLLLVPEDDAALDTYSLLSEVCSLNMLLDFVCTLSCIGAMMLMYDELLEKYLVFDVYRTVEADDRSTRIVFKKVLVGIEEDLLELSKYIGIMHQQVRSILDFRAGFTMIEPLPNIEDPVVQYDVWKHQADLCLDLDFLQHRIFHAKASDLTFLPAFWHLV